KGIYIFILLFSSAIISTRPKCTPLWFGRKRMLLVSYLGTLIFGLLSSASVSYSMFAVTWTLTGMSICGLSIIVLPLEHRTMLGVISSLFWSFGNMLLALIAYLVRDWHWLLLTTSLPCIVGIISVWWVNMLFLKNSFAKSG
uniref:Uncharacterized protein n=1 Tax=Pseudonaja textilis TaxID=8673 RepID=A0A670Y1C0_PSETE